MKGKSFDCVEMKREIQARLLTELKGLSPEEQIRLTKRRINSDPFWGPRWKRLSRTGSAAGTKKGSPPKG